MHHIYRVECEEGPFQGGLYELERLTTFSVNHNAANEVVMTFEGRLSASLDKDSDTWGEASLTGVSGIMLNPDETCVTVLYFDGHKENIPLVSHF